MYKGEAVKLLPERSLTTLNSVHCIDALSLLRAQGDKSIDAIITDPPYGFGLNKEWDKPVEPLPVLTEFYRVLQPNSFLAFTMTMPYALNWLNIALEVGFKWKEHIAWIKRNTGAYGAGLSHGHESLWILTKGKANYVETKGLYVDVKVPGVMFDVISIEGIQRHISDLRREIKTGKKTSLESGSRRDEHIRRGGTSNERSPEFSNFTNVWSFLPENVNKRGLKFHGSTKPVKMWERLLCLLTNKGATVLDPYVGSGTTALVCQKHERHYIVGDTSPEYIQTTHRRLAHPGSVELRSMLAGKPTTLPLHAGISR